jgi:hypothetical protein
MRTFLIFIATLFAADLAGAMTGYLLGMNEAQTQNMGRAGLAIAFTAWVAWAVIRRTKGRPWSRAGLLALLAVISVSAFAHM